MKFKLIRKITQSIFKQDKHLLILFISVITYILYFTIITFLKHDNFFTGRFDLGNMDQTVWNTIRGRIFQMTDSNGTEITSRLAFHADFILILLSPLYLIWESPKMLILIQTIFLSFGAVFVYLISKEVLKNKSTSLVFAISYLINPAVNFTNLYDFHPVTLATSLLLGAFYFLIKRKHFWMTAFLLLAGISKEQVWIIVFLFGLYIILKQKKITLGILISSMSILIFYLLIWKIMPSIRETQHFALKFYSDYGNSPTSIIKNILFSPLEVINVILKKGQLEFINQLFFPLGYLSFLAPFYLVFAFPDLLIDLLSNNPNLHKIYYQYTATITPFIFISAIFGAKQLNKRIPKFTLSNMAIMTLVLSFISAYIYGPLLFAKYPDNEMILRPQKNKEIIKKYIDSIPEDLSLSTTNNLGAHLSHRQKIFTIPLATRSADLVLFLIKYDPGRDPASRDSIHEGVKNNLNYELIYSLDEFYVYERIVKSTTIY